MTLLRDVSFIAAIPHAGWWGRNILVVDFGVNDHDPMWEEDSFYPGCATRWDQVMMISCLRSHKGTGRCMTINWMMPRGSMSLSLLETWEPGHHIITSWSLEVHVRKKGMKDRSLIGECRTRTKGAKRRPWHKLDQMGLGPSLHDTSIAKAMKVMAITAKQWPGSTNKR